MDDVELFGRARLSRVGLPKILVRISLPCTISVFCGAAAVIKRFLLRQSCDLGTTCEIGVASDEVSLRSFFAPSGRIPTPDFTSSDLALPPHPPHHPIFLPLLRLRPSRKSNLSSATISSRELAAENYSSLLRARSQPRSTVAPARPTACSRGTIFQASPSGLNEYILWQLRMRGGERSFIHSFLHPTVDKNHPRVRVRPPTCWSLGLA